MNIWIIVAFAIYGIVVIDLFMALVTSYYNIKGLESFKFVGWLTSIVLIIIWPISATYNNIRELIQALSDYSKRK